MSGQLVPAEVTWEADYRSSANATRAWLGWRAWFVRAVGAVLAVSIILTADDAGTIVLGVAEGLLFMTMPEWFTWITWRMSRRLGRRYVNLIDASGVTRRSELNSWFFAWAAFSRVRRTSNYWILRAGRTLIVLPASQLSSEEEARLRSYLETAGLR